MTTAEVSKLTGASLRELQWWCETGLLKVETQGHNRCWSDEEARVAIAIATLHRMKKVPLATLRKSIGKLRRALSCFNEQPTYVAFNWDGNHVFVTYNVSEVAEFCLRSRMVSLIRILF